MPEGLEPGDAFLVVLADGTQVQVLVPPGCPAGATLNVQLPQLAELLSAPVATEVPEGQPPPAPFPTGDGAPGPSVAMPSVEDQPMPSMEERLELMRAPNSSSGYHGVTKQSSGGKLFLAQIRSL